MAAPKPPRVPAYRLHKAGELATGVRPHPTTCSRWVRKGVGGIRLKAKHLGGRPLTTLGWVDEFIAALTEAAGLAD